MLQYIAHIILPYIHRVREMLGDENLSALILMDNFKGKITNKVQTLLGENSVLVA